MARNRVPTVGAKQLHVAQLTPEVRRILKHRADEAARRETAPVIAADRGLIGAAKQQYRSEAASARGATSAVESALAQALAGLKGSGLSGRYLGQAKSEFTSRAADAASALPSLLAGAGEERGKAIGEARQTIAEDKAAMQQSAASKFNSSLSEERNAATSFLDAQAKKRQEEGEDGGLSDSEHRKIQNAAVDLQNALHVWAANSPIPSGEFAGKTPQQINPLKTASDWRQFAAGLVSNGEGYDITAAMQAIHAFLKQRKKREVPIEAHGSVQAG
jgi:hypothetical protein